MSEAYRILGLTPNASDRAVRRAYRKAKKNNKPQKYHDEQLTDFSKARAKEIQNAYKQIVATRKGLPISPKRNTDDEERDIRYAIVTFAEIREMIEEDRLDTENSVITAEASLRCVPVTQQTAEWHYLMGCVLCKKCYFLDAQLMLRRACNLDPKNEEYQIKLDETEEKAKKYYKKSTASQFSGDACAEGCIACSCEACCEGCCTGICEAGCDC